MRISDLGWKDKKVEVRETSIGALKLMIIDRYIRKGLIDVVLMEITSGTVTTFHNVQDVVSNNWWPDCRIEIINTSHTYGIIDSDKPSDHKLIIQLAEDERDSVIQ